MQKQNLSYPGNLINPHTIIVDPALMLRAVVREILQKQLLHFTLMDVYEAPVRRFNCLKSNNDDLSLSTKVNIYNESCI